MEGDVCNILKLAPESSLKKEEKDTSNTHNSFLYEDLTNDFCFCPCQRATEENHTALPMGHATRL